MLKLVTEKRNIFGKSLEKARKNGQLPVVVYGRKAKNQSLFVKIAEFKKVFAAGGESSIISLNNPDGEERALIHDVAFHPVTGEPVHADFYVVEKDVTLEVSVPIEFMGIAPAVKELGGTLVKVLRELEIEVLPKDLPSEISVDISSLATLESQILVRDLALPTGVRVINDADEVVISVMTVVEEQETSSEPVDLSSIEVEKRGKEETPDPEEGVPDNKN